MTVICFAVCHLVILLYAVSLVVSVVEYPFEEQMYYSSQRVKGWWKYPTSSEFDSALDAWHAANFFRTALRASLSPGGLRGY